ncbi:hypothetical protein BSLG_004442 [Batrachochytrium salamandrivorans]|nr:hypothetical protein BSLG_004442 [Batrachochytrium salamandrivorans]
MLGGTTRHYPRSTVDTSNGDHVMTVPDTTIHSVTISDTRVDMDPPDSISRISHTLLLASPSLSAFGPSQRHSQRHSQSSTSRVRHFTPPTCLVRQLAQNHLMDSSSSSNSPVNAQNGLICSLEDSNHMDHVFESDQQSSRLTQMSDFVYFRLDSSAATTAATITTTATTATTATTTAATVVAAPLENNNDYNNNDYNSSDDNNNDDNNNLPLDLPLPDHHANTTPSLDTTNLRDMSSTSTTDPSIDALILSTKDCPEPNPIQEITPSATLSTTATKADAKSSTQAHPPLHNGRSPSLSFVADTLALLEATSNQLEAIIAQHSQGSPHSESSESDYIPLFHTLNDFARMDRVLHTDVTSSDRPDKQDSTNPASLHGMHYDYRSPISYHSYSLQKSQSSDSLTGVHYSSDNQISFQPHAYADTHPQLLPRSLDIRTHPTYHEHNMSMDEHASFRSANHSNSKQGMSRSSLLNMLKNGTKKFTKRLTRQA